MKKNHYVFIVWITTVILYCFPFHANATKKNDPVVIAYVTSWSYILPDPEVITHINYAFGHVNESFNGISISNEERLRTVVGLKKKPTLKILLSIGGWGSGRFSEMAASAEHRADLRQTANA